MRLIGDKIIQGYLKAITPFEVMLTKLKIHPNTITWAGLLVTAGAAYLFKSGCFLWGGLVLAAAGTCDVLDGRIARNTGQKSQFGAFLDSTVDRYSDVLLFIGIMMYFDRMYVNVLVMFAIAGSLLTSYARARAEGLGLECKVGLMQRPERITYVAAAAFFDGLFGKMLTSYTNIEHFLVIAVLFFIAGMSNITVFQRIVHIRTMLRETK
ncbi:MAG: CDP-alcohol phosphatidyltransferase family protein [candidate division Zixibacteria bacterium]|nr:CDP-alcohol phosphatidyltransferase family protein [candidate division Zixibacteria bacterium]